MRKARKLRKARQPERAREPSSEVHWDGSQASALWPFPGLGPFIAAGPIMTALAGVGVGGTVGGLTGALIGLGIPEYEAKRYEGRMKRGGILLSVHSDNADWTKKAKRILEETGADDISSTGEAAADYAKSDKPQPRRAKR